MLDFAKNDFEKLDLQKRGERARKLIFGGKLKGFEKMNRFYHKTGKGIRILDKGIRILDKGIQIALENFETHGIQENAFESSIKGFESPENILTTRKRIRIH